MGNYSVKTAIFPLKDDGSIQSLDKTIMTNGFPLEKVTDKTVEESR